MSSQPTTQGRPFRQNHQHALVQRGRDRSHYRAGCFCGDRSDSVIRSFISSPTAFLASATAAFNFVVMASVVLLQYPQSNRQDSRLPIQASTFRASPNHSSLRLRSVFAVFVTVEDYCLFSTFRSTVYAQHLHVLTPVKIILSATTPAAPHLTNSRAATGEGLNAFFFFFIL